MSCTIGGEAVILSVNDGTYYGLNEVGARIWNLIQQPRTISELRGVLLTEYDVDGDRCQEEIEQLISQLETKRLVEVTRGHA